MDRGSVVVVRVDDPRAQVQPISRLASGDDELPSRDVGGRERLRERCRPGGPGAEVAGCCCRLVDVADELLDERGGLLGERLAVVDGEPPAAGGVQDDLGVDGVRGDAGLAGPDGVVDLRLAGLVAVLGGTDSPRTVIAWLRAGRSRDLLVAIARGQLPLTHEALDEQTGQFRKQANAVENPRQLMVTSSALPYRDEHASRLERTLAPLLAGLEGCRHGTGVKRTAYAAAHH